MGFCFKLRSDNADFYSSISSHCFSNCDRSLPDTLAGSKPLWQSSSRVTTLLCMSTASNGFGSIRKPGSKCVIVGFRLLSWPLWGSRFRRSVTKKTYDAVGVGGIFWFMDVLPPEGVGTISPFFGLVWCSECPFQLWRRIPCNSDGLWIRRTLHSLCVAISFDMARALCSQKLPRSISAHRLALHGKE